MTYPNGIATTYEYDTESRVERITAKLGASVVTDFQYLYNAVGNRTQKQTLDFTETYGYDRSDQLAGVIRTGTAANQWHFAYDPAGNRTTEQVGNAPMQATYDNMNRLVSTSAGGALTFKGSLNEAAALAVDGHPAVVDGSNGFEGVVESTAGTNTVTVVATDPSSNTRTNVYEVSVSGDAISYGFDSNGNLIEMDDGTDVWSYEWDATNRLMRVLINAAEVVRFAYDPMGRRVEKVGGGTTSYTYDGEDIVRELADTTITVYVHGAGIDEPLAKEESGSVTYYHADGQGSIAASTDMDGEVVHEYRYDVWGRRETGATEPGFAFTGREWDPEAQLYYYRARYFDPATGRFLSEDPRGYSEGPNLYRYAEMNPTTYVDPTGESAAGAVCTWVAGDVGIPDPTDVVPAKWVTYAAMVAGAAAVDWLVWQKSNAKKVPKPGVSGKEGAKDIPSFAEGERPFVDEDGKTFADRVMNDHYGEGNWEKSGEQYHEWSKIKKYGDRSFMDP